MNRKLLTVEDNRKIADLISNVGTLAGFDTRTATTESEFITAYNQFQPDVIVLDIVMPDMDGFEVLQFLKRNNSETRIIILSGEDSFRRMAENMGKVYGLFIDANIQKPFRVDALRKILEKIKTYHLDHQKRPAESGAA